MFKKSWIALLACTVAFPALAASEVTYTRALEDFRSQPATAPFFRDAVGYALFPTIGKAGFIIGGAYGKGRVYHRGVYIGNVATGQGSIGWQFGGQAFSEIIFFQTDEALEEFTSNGFQFGADASAVALTAGAQASASTKGPSASAGVSSEQSSSAAQWYRGMAVFTLTKGGLMVSAAIGGQGFDYEPLTSAARPAAAPPAERSPPQERIRLEPVPPEEAW